MNKNNKSPSQQMEEGMNNYYCHYHSKCGTCKYSDQREEEEKKTVVRQQSSKVNVAKFKFCATRCILLSLDTNED